MMYGRGGKYKQMEYWMNEYRCGVLSLLNWILGLEVDCVGY